MNLGIKRLNNVNISVHFLECVSSSHCASTCALGEETVQSTPVVMIQMMQLHKGAQVYLLLLRKEEKYFTLLFGFIKYVNAWLIIEVFTLP